MWPAPARALLAQAVLMLSVTDLALSGEGAAVSAGEMAGRQSALRRLRDAATRGMEAACSAQESIRASSRG